MDMSDLGLNSKILLSGFAGGIVHTFFFGEKNIWAISGTIIGGMLTANYVGEFTASIAHVPDTLGGFLVGLSAMIVCQGIMGMVKSRINSKGRGDESDSRNP